LGKRFAFSFKVEELTKYGNLVWLQGKSGQIGLKGTEEKHGLFKGNNNMVGEWKKYRS
jgi:hypothetical protein